MHENRNVFLFLTEINIMHRTRRLGSAIPKGRHSETAPGVVFAIFHPWDGQLAYSMLFSDPKVWKC